MRKTITTENLCVPVYTVRDDVLKPNCPRCGMEISFSKEPQNKQIIACKNCGQKIVAWPSFAGACS